MEDHLNFLAHTFHAHNSQLVFLSIAIAIAASFISLELAARIRMSPISARLRWIALAALTMGSGIWSMHFVAILAIKFPFNELFDVAVTLLSLLIAIVFAGVGLYIVYWEEQTWRRLLVGGTIMGLGVAAMHYSGMAAVAVPVATAYRPAIVALSIIVAIIASIAALWLSGNIHNRLLRALSAIVMGIAIAGMHFTGMAAYVLGSEIDHNIVLTGLPSAELKSPIQIAMAVVVLCGIALAYVDRVSSKLSQSALRDFGLSALAAESYTTASVRALEAVRGVLRVDTAAVILFDPASDLVTSIISRDKEAIRVEKSALNQIALDSPYRAVMEGREVLKSSKIESPEDKVLRQRWIESSLRSGIVVPSQRDKGLVTAVGAYSRVHREFRDSDEQFLRAMAEMLMLLSGRDRATADLRLRDQALTSIAQGITVSDLSALSETIIYANPAFSKMVGYPLEDIIGSELRKYITPASLERVAAQIALAKVKKRSIRFEVEGRCRDGSTFTDEVIGSYLINEDGEATHSVLVHEDMTEAKGREEKLRELQRLETVGQLTGGVAHDFNNLLTVVRANAEDLTQELKHNEDLGFQASMILEAADRGADLVRQLMAFSRKQELAPEAVDLNALVDVVAGLSRRTFPANIEIAVKKGSDIPAVNVDAGQLQTAILNVAVNGRDAMEEGGTLTIETGDAVLDNEYAKENLNVQAGSYALISISDTGVGMEPKVLRRVFDPFFTTKEVGKGSGLGLSMVYGFVRQSGGHVKIYSEPFIGTTVKIYLPPIQATQHYAIIPQEIEGEQAQPRSGNILLVEDDPLVRKSVNSKLRRMGYDVSAVASATEAMVELEKAPFALVFSDVIMPGTMNGADLVREISRRWPKTRVLLTSGYTEAAVLGKVHIPDGVRLLSKPYTNDALLDAISDLLAA